MTDPWLMTYCQGTLALTVDKIFTYLRFYYYLDMHKCGVDRALWSGFSPRTSPPYQIWRLCDVSFVISVAGLVPIIFSAFCLGK